MKEEIIETIKEKKIIILIVAIILIILAFLLIPQTQTINQEINYPDFKLEKTIQISNERNETYSLNTQNPAIGYLIIPPTITQDPSKITLSGDYDFQITNNKQIIKITQKNYSPGKKTLNIKTTIGEKKHSTILILIPLTEYNNFTNQEKEELENTITQILEIEEKYFSIDETKKIMQEFANTLNTTELKKKTTNTNIYFSNNNNTYITAVNRIVENRINNNQISQETTTPQEQQTPTTQNNFLAINQNLQNIINSRKHQEITLTGDYLITINFREEDQLFKLPREIIIPYSENNEYVTWNGIIILEENQTIPNDTIPQYESTKDIEIDFFRITNENIELISENIESQEIKELKEKIKEKNNAAFIISITYYINKHYNQLRKENIEIKFPLFLANTHQTKLTLIKNNCSSNINIYNSETNPQLIQNNKEEEILNAILCKKQEFEEEVLKIIQELDSNFLYTKEIHKTLLLKSIEHDPQSTKELQKELNKKFEEFKKNYNKSNETLKNKIQKTKSLTNTKISQINELKNHLIDKNNLFITTSIIHDLNIFYSELDLKLDPTNIQKRRQIIQMELDFIKENFEETDQETLNNIINKLQKEYLQKYGPAWDREFITEISKMHFQTQEELKQLEKQFASLLLQPSRGFSTSLNITSGINCPTLLSIDEIYDTTMYDPQQYKDFREIVKYLILSPAHTIGSEITPTIDGQRELSKIEQTITRFQNTTGCNINLAEFENPSRAWHDYFRSDADKKITEFSNRRDGLREQIKTKIKEKVGLEILTDLLYDSYQLKTEYELRNPNNKLIETTIEFGSIYEDIKVKERELTLLEVFESIDDINKLKHWTEKQDYLKATLLQEVLNSIFKTQLRPTINTITHTKFNPNIGDYSMAEKLESELMYIDNLIETNMVLIAKKNQSAEDNKKINYVIYNLVSGRMFQNLDPEINILFRTILGLREIKQELLLGKTLIEIYNEEEIRLAEENIDTTPPNYFQTRRAPESSIAGGIAETQNEITTNNINPALNTFATNLENQGINPNKILAFQNPLLKIELEKENIIARNIENNFETLMSQELTEEQKKELIMPKNQESEILLQIANYYYNIGLYEYAATNYSFIANNFKGTNAEIQAKRRLGQLGNNWRLFFGKYYWETYGTITREITSLRMIATYLSIYGTIRFVAIPQIAGTKMVQKATIAQRNFLLDQAGAKGALLTSRQAHELASLNAMQKGVKGYEIINGRLVPLSAPKYIGEPSKIWLKTKTFFKESRIWAELKRDRIISEQWYRNFVETKIAQRMTTEFTTKLTPDKISQNIINLAKTGSTEAERAFYINQAIAKLNIAQTGGFITTRQAQQVASEIRFLSATDITSQASTFSKAQGPVSSLQTIHAQQQLLPISFAQQARVAIASPTAKIMPLENAIKLSKTAPAIKAEGKALETQRKLSAVDKRIQTLEGYIAQNPKATTPLLHSWRTELLELNILKANLQNMAYQGQPLTIACSICTFTYGQTRTNTFTMDPNKVLNLTQAQVNQMPASFIRINQTIMPGINQATVQVIKTGHLGIDIIIQTPKTIAINNATGIHLTDVTEKIQYCPQGCTHTMKTATITNDPSLATKEKLVDGTNVDMKRVESIVIEKVTAQLKLKPILSEIPQIKNPINKNTPEITKWINDGEKYGSKNIRQMLVNKIEVISPQRFDAELKNSINQFNQHNSSGEPYAVIFDDTAGKSRRWIFEKIRGDLSQKPATGFYDSQSAEVRDALIKDGVKHFVIFDDAMYSGQQMLNTVLRLTSDLTERIKITIVTPFSTTDAISSITAAVSKRNVELKIINSRKINTIAESLTDSDKTMLSKHNDPEINKFRSFQTTTIMPHKTPDYVSFPKPIAERLTPTTEPYKLNTTYLFEEQGQVKIMVWNAQNLQTTLTTTPKKISFLCGSPCLLSNNYSHQIVGKKPENIKSVFQNPTNISSIAVKEVILPSDTSKIFNLVQKNGLYKRLPDGKISPYSEKDIEELIYAAEMLRPGFTLIATHYILGRIELIYYTREITPTQIPKIDEETIQSNVDEQIKYMLHLNPDSKNVRNVVSRRFNTREELNNKRLFDIELMNNPNSLERFDYTILDEAQIKERKNIFIEIAKEFNLKMTNDPAWIYLYSGSIDYDIKFYLNLRNMRDFDSQNAATAKVFREVFRRTQEEGINIGMKTSSKTADPIRADGTVIYANKRDGARIAEILRDIQIDFPELFDPEGRIPLLSKRIAHGIGAAFESKRTSFGDDVVTAYLNSVERARTYGINNKEIIIGFVKEELGMLFGRNPQKPYLFEGDGDIFDSFTRQSLQQKFNEDGISKGDILRLTSIRGNQRDVEFVGFGQRGIHIIYNNKEVTYYYDQLEKYVLLSKSSLSDQQMETPRKIFSRDEFDGLDNTKLISDKRAINLKRAFDNSIKELKLRYPKNKLFDDFVLFEGGSVARAEATHGTDYDFGIVAVQNNQILSSQNKEYLAAKRKIEDHLFGSLSSESEFIGDPILETSLEGLSMGEKLTIEAHSTIIDARFLAGNPSGKTALKELQQKTYSNPTLLNQIKVELRELTSIEGIENWTVKGNKRELDLLLFVLKIENDIAGVETIEAINLLVQKNALTHEQGRRLLSQYNDLIKIRLKLDIIKEHYIYDFDELNQFRKNYGSDAFDDGYVYGFKKDISEFMKIDEMEFERIYERIVNNNRQLIREIMSEN